MQGLHEWVENLKCDIMACKILLSGMLKDPELSRMGVVQSPYPQDANNSQYRQRPPVGSWRGGRGASTWRWESLRKSCWRVIKEPYWNWQRTRTYLQYPMSCKRSGIGKVFIGEVSTATLNVNDSIRQTSELECPPAYGSSLPRGGRKPLEMSNVYERRPVCLTRNFIDSGRRNN